MPRLPVPQKVNLAPPITLTSRLNAALGTSEILFLVGMYTPAHGTMLTPLATPPGFWAAARTGAIVRAARASSSRIAAALPVRADRSRLNMAGPSSQIRLPMFGIDWKIGRETVSG